LKGGAGQAIDFVRLDACAGTRSTTAHTDNVHCDCRQQGCQNRTKNQTAQWFRFQDDRENEGNADKQQMVISLAPFAEPFGKTLQNTQIRPNLLKVFKKGLIDHQHENECQKHHAQ